MLITATYTRFCIVALLHKLLFNKHYRGTALSRFEKKLTFLVFPLHPSFADDINLIFHAPNLDRLMELAAENLTTLQNFLNCNDIQINKEKTNFVLFYPKGKEIEPNFKI